MLPISRNGMPGSSRRDNLSRGVSWPRSSKRGFLFSDSRNERPFNSASLVVSASISARLALNASDTVLILEMKRGMGRPFSNSGSAEAIARGERDGNFDRHFQQQLCVTLALRVVAQACYAAAAQHLMKQKIERVRPRKNETLHAALQEMR